nr:NAD(P)-dependent alcohol dehydrogenase [Pseudomonadota bacterium]
MIKTHAYAARSADKALAPHTIERRAPGPHDVQIDILFCGVCHSDLHTARNEWKNTQYPSVPGHEIVGTVTAVGNQVKNFKTGDTVGVGCMVDSCGHCVSCKEGEENYCENGFTATYNGRMTGGESTYGGYSDKIVVDEKFVLRISEKLDPAAAAPLLCAGITTWSPLRHWRVGKGHRVGVVGLGGLGHMAIKLAHALGAHVVLFTTSPDKREDARKLGADEVVISKDAEAMSGRANSLDFIINTVAAPHNLDAFLTLLKRDGVM